MPAHPWYNNSIVSSLGLLLVPFLHVHCEFFSKTKTRKQSLQGLRLRHNPNKHVCSTRWRDILSTRIPTKLPLPSPSPTPTSELANVGDLITNIDEFVVPHICVKYVVKCVCSAPDSRMITIAEPNLRITVSHFAKILLLEY